MDSVIKQRLDYLYETAHKMYATNPQLSSHLLVEFSKLATRENVSLPISITTTFCQRCGSLCLPGVNAEVTVQEKGRKGCLVLNPGRNSTSKDPVKNYIIYDCRICEAKMLINGQKESEIRKKERPAKSITKKKKLKKSLEGLISSKVEPKESGYNLQDFLSDL